MTKSKIGQVVSYIAILLVIVAAIGVFSYFTNGFTTDFKTFYVSVNGKDVMTTQNGYVVTPSEPLKVGRGCPWRRSGGTPCSLRSWWSRRRA